MKLWLLDADATIDLLSINVFDSLIKNHKVHCATTVIDEVLYYYSNGEKRSIDFRVEYIENDRVKEISATSDDIYTLNQLLPQIKFKSLDKGELESLALLHKNKDHIFCSCDAAAIRVLPLLDAEERGISVEKLLQKTGLSKKGLVWKNTEKYFQKYLKEGKIEKIEYFTEKNKK